MAANGIELVTPSSVTKTGTGSTATIGANGSVTFADCTALSLNGVFTSSYRDYMIVCHMELGASTTTMMRLRASGTDSTATTDYNYTSLQVSSTSETGLAVTNLGYWILGSMIGASHCAIAWIYGPQISDTTAMRSLTGGGTTLLLTYDVAGNHELSSSYDGFTLRPTGSGGLTGLLCVYGLVF